VAKFSMSDLLNTQSKVSEKPEAVKQLIINRTPDIIAGEINSIKDKTREIVLSNSIEIGRKLTEAKELLQHGNWGEWLESSVSYSKSTANNLMRIFEEYGSEQINMLGNNAKSQALGDLSYTQALLLLGISSDQRENFIKENDLDNMSTRELQQTIKEKHELEDKLKAINEEMEMQKNSYEIVSNSYDAVVETNKKNIEQSHKLKQEIELIKSENKETLINKEAAIQKLRIDMEHIKNQIPDTQSSGENKELKMEVQELREKLNQKNREIDKTETIRLLKEIASDIESGNDGSSFDIRKICEDAAKLLDMKEGC
jgi:hypothetical protein